MRKKNGAHTHVRTTVQLDEHNIHVGCCLFSHDEQNKNTQNLLCELFRIEDLFVCSSIIFFGREIF